MRCARVSRALGPDVIGGRNAVGPAQILGEALRAFEPGRRSSGAEHGDPRSSKRIGDAGDQRRFGPDHDEIDSRAPPQFHDCLGIAGIECDTIRPSRNAGIPGRGNQLAAARRLPKAPGERILAAARAQKQYIDGSS